MRGLTSWKGVGALTLAGMLFSGQIGWAAEGGAEARAALKKARRALAEVNELQERMDQPFIVQRQCRMPDTICQDGDQQDQTIELEVACQEGEMLLTHGFSTSGATAYPIKTEVDVTAYQGEGGGRVYPSSVKYEVSRTTTPGANGWGLCVEIFCCDI